MSATFIDNWKRVSKSEPWNWESDELDENPRLKENIPSPRQLRLFQKHSHIKKFDHRAKSAKSKPSDIPNKKINSINPWNTNNSPGIDKSLLDKTRTLPPKSLPKPHPYKPSAIS